MIFGRAQSHHKYPNWILSSLLSTELPAWEMGVHFPHDNQAASKSPGWRKPNDHDTWSRTNRQESSPSIPWWGASWSLPFCHMESTFAYHVWHLPYSQLTGPCNAHTWSYSLGQFRELWTPTTCLRLLLVLVTLSWTQLGFGSINTISAQSISKIDNETYSIPDLNDVLLINIDDENNENFSITIIKNEEKEVKNIKNSLDKDLIITGKYTGQKIDTYQIITGNLKNEDGTDINNDYSTTVKSFRIIWGE